MARRVFFIDTYRYYSSGKTAINLNSLRLKSVSWLTLTNHDCYWSMHDVCDMARVRIPVDTSIPAVSEHTYTHPNYYGGTVIVFFSLSYHRFYFPTKLLLVYGRFHPRRPSGQAVVTGVVPSAPRYKPSFLSRIHSVQYSHCSSIFMECKEDQK